MIRTLTIAAGLAATASTASAALVGFEVRESAAVNAAASATTIGQPARVLRLYAIFDGAGLIGEDPAVTPDPNELTGVTNTAVGATTFSLTSGSFYQDPFGTNLPPNPPFIGLAPSLAFDSYVGIGKLVDSAVASADAASSTSPDFNWTSPTAIIGSWFNSAPGVNNNGAAVLDATGKFSVFAGQFTVLGAGAGGDRVEAATVTGSTLRGIAGTVSSELLQGTIQVGVRVPGSTPSLITFVPTPGALALFGVAGLAAARRRRNA